MATTANANITAIADIDRFCFPEDTATAIVQALLSSKE